MLTKEECKESLIELFVYSKHIANKVEIQSLNECYERLEQLINEHFDNSADFNHFKLYADSTLKTFKKDELIDYIHMLYHNWQSTDWYYNNTVKVNYKLQSEVDELKSNPPLKYEELKEGMLVWDNLYKFYVSIVTVCESHQHFYVKNYDGVGRLFKFEENRYFRKQVEK